MPDPKGDYESTTVAHPPWVPFTLYRTMLVDHLQSAGVYMQQFGTPSVVAETVKGTTAIGISQKVFGSLKAGQTVPLTIYQTILPGIPVKEDGSSGMFGMEYRLPGQISLADSHPVPIQVLVNDRLTTLPAIARRKNLSARKTHWHARMGLGDLEDSVQCRLDPGEIFTISRVATPDRTTQRSQAMNPSPELRHAGPIPNQPSLSTPVQYRYPYGVD